MIGNKIIYLILFVSVSSFGVEKVGVELYNDYYSKIKSLYFVSLKLSKRAKDENYKNEKLHEKIQKNIHLVTKYCSDSYESQIYYQAQKQARDTSTYQYSFSQISKKLFNNRRSLYKKCKRMKALLSRTSFKLAKKTKKQMVSSEVQNHQSLCGAIQHKYKEIKGIKEKLFDNSISTEIKKELISYYQNYRDFDCDWEYEKKLYINAKVYLKAKIAKAKNNTNKDRRRGVASDTKLFEVESILGELEKRHVSFEHICDDVQLVKDKINTKISDFY